MLFLANRAPALGTVSPFFVFLPNRTTCLRIVLPSPLLLPRRAALRFRILLPLLLLLPRRAARRLLRWPAAPLAHSRRKGAALRSVLQLLGPFRWTWSRVLDLTYVVLDLRYVLAPSPCGRAGLEVSPGCPEPWLLLPDL